MRSRIAKYFPTIPLVFYHFSRWWATWATRAMTKYTVSTTVRNERPMKTPATPAISDRSSESFNPQVKGMRKKETRERAAPTHRVLGNLGVLDHAETSEGEVHHGKVFSAKSDQDTLFGRCQGQGKNVRTVSPVSLSASCLAAKDSLSPLAAEPDLQWRRLRTFTHRINPRIPQSCRSGGRTRSESHRMLHR
jgi:hypothetical protein